METDPIFIVDDEPSIREILESILQDEGYSVIACANAADFFSKLSMNKPALVLLDIWLPGADGVEVLAQFKKEYSEVPVIMISGHAGIEAAVNSIKMGAFDFLEKPLHLEVLLDKITSALAHTSQTRQKELPADTRLEIATVSLDIQQGAVTLEESNTPQRTLKNNIVLNGTGLLSGRNTGIILNPSDANTGVVFQSLDGKSIPGHVTSLEDFSQTSNTQIFTANSTVLVKANRRVRTIEHLMAALHMFGLTNVLIKVDEEIPNIDSSAAEFCRLIQEAGIVDQAKKTKNVVIHEKISVGVESPDEKYLYVEPFDGFNVQMRVNYPAPIFEQSFDFTPDRQSFEKEIAPARSFNTFENIDMAQKLGKVGTGYLNSHIIMHDGKVINTELRYPDEFVRHKILDLLGDLYLLGYSIRGRVVANMTSHGYNQALVQKIYMTLEQNNT